MMTETTRQQKVARLIQKDLSEIFRAASPNITQGKMVSVTIVRMSPDLSVAKIYLSIFPSDHPDDFLKNLKPHTRQMRYDLGKKVRHQLRIIPELAFFIDNSLDYAERIDELLK